MTSRAPWGPVGAPRWLKVVVGGLQVLPWLGNCDTTGQGEEGAWDMVLENTGLSPRSASLFDLLKGAALASSSGNSALSL